MHKTQVAVLVAAACLCAPAVFAQEGAPPPDVRIKIGPLSMNPMINLSNIGVDHNVFNDPASNDPKSDFTATIVPATDFWLRAGPTWITSTLLESITWYQKYSTERSATTQYKLGWVVPLSRVTFKVNGEWRNAKERPGYEIDGRVNRKEHTYLGSVGINLVSKTYLDVGGSYITTDFAEDAVFDGTHLDLALNRHTTTETVGIRQQVTTLTSLSFTGTHSVDDFVYAQQRNSTTNSAMMILSFQPAALMKGNLSVGYNQFTPDSPLLPSYSGLAYTVDLTYVLLGSTRFSVQGSRGIQYSYDSTQPYYVQTGISGGVAQELFGPLDVAVRVGTQNLAYRDLAGAAVAVPDRQDNVISYGVGLGYHIGRDLRLSFNVDKVYRDSKINDRTYDNYTFSSSLHYGF